MADIVDLDALLPDERIVKYENDEIKIPPPKTGDLLKLGVLAQRMADVEDIKDDELQKRVLDLTMHVYKMIPALNERPLNLLQLQTLIQILSEMATPKDVTELTKKGITPDTGSKKAVKS
jgi:hypothetical protein